MVVLQPQYSSKPDFIVLPDFLSYCSWTSSTHPSLVAIAEQSSKWLEKCFPGLSEKGRERIYRHQYGALAAYCYPECDETRLRTIADFITFLFHIDDLFDGTGACGTKEMADIIMNALWFPDKYMPTKTATYEEPAEEPNVGKTCRE